eukprot:4865976-Ditylum_brightwellii.AAC.1
MQEVRLLEVHLKQLYMEAKQEVQCSEEARQHVVEARERAVSKKKLFKQDTKSMQAEFSAQKKSFAERE